eukprot:TRINITY_DN863_c0_g1_i1.p1 TRINITY_DN863_c0_g1~~TRINITY_DN863_c0_g1_i1.p1  ORF type:complete len:1384 (+),score=305.02 TRINITY_DN863_c0_g1_i1:130-4152(+)
MGSCYCVGTEVDDDGTAVKSITTCTCCRRGATVIDVDGTGTASDPDSGAVSSETSPDSALTVPVTGGCSSFEASGGGSQRHTEELGPSRETTQTGGASVNVTLGSPGSLLARHALGPDADGSPRLPRRWSEPDLVLMELEAYSEGQEPSYASSACPPSHPFGSARGVPTRAWTVSTLSHDGDHQRRSGSSSFSPQSSAVTDTQTRTASPRHPSQVHQVFFGQSSADFFSAVPKQISVTTEASPASRWSRGSGVATLADMGDGASGGTFVLTATPRGQHRGRPSVISQSSCGGSNPLARSTWYPSFRQVDTADVQVDNSGVRFVNEYRVIRLVGSGRYGEVYLVQHANSFVEYAMKQVHKGSDAQSGSHRAESEILMKLRHNNVVRIFEIIDDPAHEHAYMIFEYVDGGPIMEIDGNGVAKGPPLEVTKLRDYVTQIADGLQYLHDLNIVHCDIKPDNILVTRKGVIKIADLGVSRLLRSQDDLSRSTGGTPMFFSPEACQGDFSSGKCNDVWAFGVTVYILVYGRVPFVGANTQMQLFNLILTKKIEYPPPAQLDPGEWRQLHALLRRMLQRDPLMRITLNEIRHSFWVMGTALLPEREMKELREICPRSPAEQMPWMPRSPQILVGRVSVLVVEDTYIMQKLLENMFRMVLAPNVELIIKSVSDGLQAVEACEAHRYDIALMDVHMSRCSGITATGRIRKYEAEHDLPRTNIIGLTGDYRDDVVELCFEAGMHDVVAKPLRPAKLREICEQCDLPVAKPTFDGGGENSAPLPGRRGGKKQQAMMRSFEAYLNSEPEPIPQSPSNQAAGRTSPFPSPVPQSRGHGSGGSISIPGQGSQGVISSQGAVSSESVSTQSPTPVGSHSPSALVTVDSAKSSNDDLRSRSLKCMAVHKDMYKRKNCDRILGLVEEDEIDICIGPVLTRLYTALGWPAAGRLGAEAHAACRRCLRENMEDVLKELRAVSGSASVPLSELLDKVETFDWWTLAQDRARESIPAVMPLFEVFPFAEKGLRSHMEDCFSVMLHPTAACTDHDPGPSGAEVMVGVFDGHGGVDAAAYCARQLLALTGLHESFLSDPATALADAFRATHSSFFRKAGAITDAGTTALVMLARGDTLTIANAGDCRAVLSTGGVARSLTRQHVASDPDERQLVESRGGEVIHYSGSWRVNGVLYVTRSIGDAPCHKVITCEPDIHVHKITAEDEFVIIASDGLWDVITPEEAVECVCAAKEEIDEQRAGSDKPSAQAASPERLIGSPSLSDRLGVPASPSVPLVEGRAASAQSFSQSRSRASQRSLRSRKSCASTGSDGQLDCSMLPEALVSEALERGSGDNITCVILMINH